MRRWLGPRTPYYLGLLLAFGVALGLRLAVAGAFQGLASPPSFNAQPDQLDYEQLAFSMSTGAGYALPDGRPTARRPPGTSLTLLPIYVVAGHSYAWGRFWFCLLSALTCLATAWLATQCFGPAVGLVSAFWLALYPGHFYYSMHFVSEVPYAFWLTLACGLTVRALKGTSRATPFDLLAGACWGFAVLTRPQIVLVIPIVVVLALWSRRWTRREVLHLVIATSAMCAVLAPWLVRNALVMGKPTLSTVGGITFWGANNDTVLDTPALRGSWLRTSDLVDARHPLAGTEIQSEAAAWQYGFDFMAENRSSLPFLTVMKLWRLVSPFETTENRVVYWTFGAAWLLTAPWLVIGIFRTAQSDRLAAGVLLAPLLATLATTIVFYGSVRFRDSVIPLLIVLAAHALVEAAPAFGMASFGRWDGSNLTLTTER